MATFDQTTKIISGRFQKFHGLPNFFGVDKKKSVANCGDRKWVTKNFRLPIVAIESWQPNLMFRSSQHSQGSNDIIFDHH
jgi:hypothetical protein